MRAYFCGVPNRCCQGSDCILSSHLRKGQPKVHYTSEAAFKCHANWLVKELGYERRGNREFAMPNGGPIVVLTKKSRFGGELRGGKRAAGKRSNRLMPARFPGGLIASY